jgi:hypothetical protein
MSLLTIIPTRSRPTQCARLIESFDKNTDNADLLFVVDPDDDSYDGFDWKGHTVTTMDPRGSMVEKLNFAAAAFLDDYDQMVWYADDNEFITPHWDTLMLKKLNDELNGTGWVYSFDNRRTDIPETWLVSTNIVKALGWFALPTQKQYYVADSLALLARRADMIRFCPEVTVTHHHYTVDPTQAHDETYATAEREFGQVDLQNFRAWSGSNALAASVSVLRREFNPDVKWLLSKV